MNTQTTLAELLQNNEKNISDLIAQEISLWSLAHQMKNYPELEEQTHEVFLKIYQSTTQTIERLLLHLIQHEDVALSDTQIQTLKQEVQTFVHILVDRKKADLRKMIHWLDHHVM